MQIFFFLFSMILDCFSIVEVTVDLDTQIFLDILRPPFYIILSNFAGNDFIFNVNADFFTRINFWPAANRQPWLPPERLLKLDISGKDSFERNFLVKFHYLSVLASDLLLRNFICHVRIRSTKKNKK